MASAFNAMEFSEWAVSNNMVSDNYSISIAFAPETEYFPVLGRSSRERRKGSEASRRSRSRSHSNTRTQSYKPPSSGSMDAGSIGSGRPLPSPSSVRQTQGQGRQPLRLSERDRYFGVGSRELGLNFGTAHSFTDLQGSKGLGFGESLNYQISNPGITFGVYSRLRMVEWFGLSLGFDFARLTGKEGGNLSGFEGYSFENNMLEFNARIVFFAPIPTKNVFDIYGFAGLGLFSNNLTLKDANGFEVPVYGDYAKLQSAIPFGVGLSWVVGYRTVLGYELGYRYTSFNMLDGIEPPDTRYDAYMFNTFRIGFILKPKKN